MKLLLDANLSPRLVPELSAAGYDATHVAQVGLVHAADQVIFDRAATDGYTLITADSDFSMLLAARGSSAPSVVHLRHVAELSPAEHLGLLIANLPAILDDLAQGAVVSLSPVRLRVRRLPIAGQ